MEQKEQTCQRGFNMRCKSVTADLFKVAGLLVETSTYIEKPKGYIEESN